MAHGIARPDERGTVRSGGSGAEQGRDEVHRARRLRRIARVVRGHEV